MPCKVSIKEDYKKLEEIYPGLCRDTENQFLKEEGYNGYICTYNSLTEYFDQVWIHPEMFEVILNEPKYSLTLKNPLSSLVNKEVSKEIWEAFQEACQEQYSNVLDYVHFCVDIKDFSQYFKISKEDILVV